MINKNIKNIKKILIIFLLVLALTPAVSYAERTLDDAQGYLKNMAEPTGINTETDVPSLTAKLIKAALGLSGLIFFGLIVYGGITWMTSRGEEEGIKKARSTITAAVIGLVITVGAYGITYFITNKIINMQTSQYAVPTQENKFGTTESLVCCIDQTGDNIHSARLATKEKCISEQGTDGYLGTQGYDWDYYEAIDDWPTCEKIFDCWDNLGYNIYDEGDKSYWTPKDKECVDKVLNSI